MSLHPKPTEVRFDPSTEATPMSLLGQRVEVPSLDEQLADYEAQQALLDDSYVELDPKAAQRVYLVVASVAGIVAAVAVAAVVGTMYVWVL